jgi:hypothetical protein
VWADTLLRAEQQHLLRLLFWSGLSILGGTAALATVVVRRFQSPLLKHFAIQMTAWGLIVAAIAGIAWRGAHFRDVSGAARLERFLWMSIGLDVGYVAIGVVLAGAAWALARRMSGVGAGTAIVVQGIALLVIDLQFAAAISR